MQKSMPILKLHTDLFNPDNYVPTSSLGGKNNYWTYSSMYNLYVYGSSLLDQDDLLIPLAYLDYAQITVFLDLNKYFNSQVKDQMLPLNCIFGIHNNPNHYSGMYLTI